MTNIALRRRWRDPIFQFKLADALDRVVLAGLALLLVGQVLTLVGGAL